MVGVVHWGTSEWTGAQLRELASLCERRGYTPPQVEQPQYNLLSRDKFEKDVAPAARELGMGTVVWSPLASGILSGKYDQGLPVGSRLDRIDWLRDGLLIDEKLAKVRRFRDLAEQCSTTRSRLAIAWAMGHPSVSSVILGATTVEQLQENLSALNTACDSDIRAAMEEIFV